MDEYREKLVADLKRLRAELEQGGKPENPVAGHLDEILASLQHAAAENADLSDHKDALGNLRTAVEHFETEHPRATAILNDIMVTLSNMGI